MERTKSTGLKLHGKALPTALLCAIFTLGAPFAVIAAEPEEAAPAANTAKPAEPQQDFILSPIVITATRTPVEAFRANANVSVITAGDIEKNHWNDLSEALRIVPGVYIGDYGVAGYQGSTSFYIGGSSDVVVLVDGIRMNRSNGGFSPQAYANLDNIERIEVLKGSSSTLYGSNAKGGVVNIITKKIAPGTKTKLSVGAGSYDTQKFSLGTEGRAKDWSWRLYYQKDLEGNIEDAKDFTWPSKLDANTYSLLVGKELGKKSDITITYDAYYTPDNKYVSLTNQAEWANGIFTNNVINNKEFKIIHNYRFDDRTSNQLSYWNSKYITTRNGGYPGTATTQRLTDQLTVKLSDANTLTAGFEYTKGEYDDQYNLGRNGLDNMAYFIQDEWNITKQLKLTGGLRFDDPSRYKSNTSKSINLGYEFSPNTNMYVSYDEHFLMPTLSNLFNAQYGNTSMRPESGHTTSVGINHKFDDSFAISAHLFKRYSKDRLSFNYGAQQYFNLPEEKADGYDIQLRKRFSPYVSAYVGYTHTHVDALPGSRTSNVDGYLPRGAWNIGVDFSKDKLDVSVLARAIVDRDGPQGDGYMFDPFFPQYDYWVWDIGVNYRPTRNIKVFLKLNNLFDTYYAEQSNATTKPGWRGQPEQWWGVPGRNFFAGVEYSF